MKTFLQFGWLLVGADWQRVGRFTQGLIYPHLKSDHCYKLTRRWISELRVGVQVGRNQRVHCQSLYATASWGTIGGKICSLSSNMIDRLTRVLGLNKPSMDLKVLTVSVCHTIHFMPHRAVRAAKTPANNKDECGGLGGLVGGPSFHQRISALESIFARSERDHHPWMSFILIVSCHGLDRTTMKCDWLVRKDGQA